MSTSKKPQQRLIDYIIIAGIDFNDDIHKRDPYSRHYGYIVQRFPYSDWPDRPLNQDVVKFCQPHGWRMYKSQQTTDIFEFVLTDQFGQRQRCTCLTFYEQINIKFKENNSENVLSDHETSDLEDKFVPKCIVVISQYELFDLFSNILQEIYDILQEYGQSIINFSPISHHLAMPQMDSISAFTNNNNNQQCSMSNYDTSDSLTNILECVFSKLLQITIADNQTCVHFKLHDFQFARTHCLKWPLISRTGCRVELLFRQLGINHVLKLFELCLEESKILFASSDYQKLNDACRALEAILYPFTYCHVFIPVLPWDMLGVIEAPTPYIIGIPTSYLKKVNQFADSSICLVNLDMAVLTIPSKTNSSDDLSSIHDINKPMGKSTLYNLLTPALLEAVQNINNNDNTFKYLHDIKTDHCNESRPNSTNLPFFNLESEKNDLNDLQKMTKFRNNQSNHQYSMEAKIRAVFCAFFVDLFGDYRKYLVLVRVCPKQIVHLNRKLLCTEKTKSFFNDDQELIQFIQNFSNTMMFNKFIEERANQNNHISTDLFEKLCSTKFHSLNHMVDQISRIINDNEKFCHHNCSILLQSNESFQHYSKKSNLTTISMPLLNSKRIERQLNDAHQDNVFAYSSLKDSQSYECSINLYDISSIKKRIDFTNSFNDSQSLLYSLYNDEPQWTHLKRFNYLYNYIDFIFNSPVSQPLHFSYLLTISRILYWSSKYRQLAVYLLRSKCKDRYSIEISQWQLFILAHLINVCLLNITQDEIDDLLPLILKISNIYYSRICTNDTKESLDRGQRLFLSVALRHINSNWLNHDFWQRCFLHDVQIQLIEFHDKSFFTDFIKANQNQNFVDFNNRVSTAKNSNVNHYQNAIGSKIINIDSGGEHAEEQLIVSLLIKYCYDIIESTTQYRNRSISFLKWPNIDDSNSNKHTDFVFKQSYSRRQSTPVLHRQSFSLHRNFQTLAVHKRRPSNFDFNNKHSNKNDDQKYSKSDNNKSSRQTIQNYLRSFLIRFIDEISTIVHLSSTKKNELFVKIDQIMQIESSTQICNNDILTDKDQLHNVHMAQIRFILNWIRNSAKQQPNFYYRLSNEKLENNHSKSNTNADHISNKARPSVDCMVSLLVTAITERPLTLPLYNAFFSKDVNIDLIDSTEKDLIVLTDNQIVSSVIVEENNCENRRCNCVHIPLINEQYCLLYSDVINVSVQCNCRLTHPKFKFNKKYCLIAFDLKSDERVFLYIKDDSIIRPFQKHRTKLHPCDFIQNLVQSLLDKDWFGHDQKFSSSSSVKDNKRKLGSKTIDLIVPTFRRFVSSSSTSNNINKKNSECTTNATSTTNDFPLLITTLSSRQSPASTSQFCLINDSIKSNVSVLSYDDHSLRSCPQSSAVNHWINNECNGKRKRHNSLWQSLSLRSFFIKRVNNNNKKQNDVIYPKNRSKDLFDPLTSPSIDNASVGGWSFETDDVYNAIDSTNSNTDISSSIKDALRNNQNNDLANSCINFGLWSEYYRMNMINDNLFNRNTKRINNLLISVCIDVSTKPYPLPMIITIDFINSNEKELKNTNCYLHASHSDIVQTQSKQNDKSTQSRLFKNGKFPIVMYKHISKKSCSLLIRSGKPLSSKNIGVDMLTNLIPPFMFNEFHNRKSLEMQHQPNQKNRFNQSDRLDLIDNRADIVSDSVLHCSKLFLNEEKKKYSESNFLEYQNPYADSTFIKSQFRTVNYDQYDFKSNYTNSLRQTKSNKAYLQGSISRQQLLYSKPQAISDLDTLEENIANYENYEQKSFFIDSSTDQDSNLSWSSMPTAKASLCTSKLSNFINHYSDSETNSTGVDCINLPIFYYDTKEIGRSHLNNNLTKYDNSFDHCSKYHQNGKQFNLIIALDDVTFKNENQRVSINQKSTSHLFNTESIVHIIKVPVWKQDVIEKSLKTLLAHIVQSYNHYDKSKFLSKSSTRVTTLTESAAEAENNELVELVIEQLLNVFHIESSSSSSNGEADKSFSMKDKGFNNSHYGYSTDLLSKHYGINIYCDENDFDDQFRSTDCQPNHDTVNDCSSTDKDNYSWLHQIYLLINEAWTLHLMLKDNFNVMIALETNSTTTGQLSFLVQLFSDPYYCTIKGFLSLLQKEWIDFMHSGYSNHYQSISKKYKNQSKTFAQSYCKYIVWIIQLLDCVYQISNKLSSMFEFNELFIQFIANIFDNCRQCSKCQGSNKFVDFMQLNSNLWNYIIVINNKLPFIFANPLFFSSPTTNPSDDNEIECQNTIVNQSSLWSLSKYSSCYSLQSVNSPLINGTKKDFPFNFKEQTCFNSSKCKNDRSCPISIYDIHIWPFMIQLSMSNNSRCNCHSSSITSTASASTSTTKSAPINNHLIKDDHYCQNAKDLTLNSKYILNCNFVKIILHFLCKDDYLKEQLNLQSINNDDNCKRTDSDHSKSFKSLLSSNSCVLNMNTYPLYNFYSSVLENHITSMSSICKLKAIQCILQNIGK